MKDIIFKIHHVSINVTNLDRSVSFYTALGLKSVYSYEDNDVSIIHLTNDDFIIELFFYKNKDIDFQPRSIKQHSSFVGCEHFSLFVEDINAAFDKFNNFCDFGETISLGRTGIKYFFIKDPDGVRIEIVEDKRRLAIK